MNRLFITGTVIGLLLIAAFISSCGTGARPIAQLDARELFAEGQMLYEKEKYRKAIEYFQTVVFNYPGNAVVDSAQYYLGLSYFGTEDYELAALEFERLVRNYPASAFFENSLFMRGVSYFEATPEHPGLDQTELQRAINIFQDFLIDYPESELIPDARAYLQAAQTRMAEKFYNAGIVYERISAHNAAKIYFQKVIDEYTDTEFAPKAAYKLAEMDLKMKNFSAARDAFQGFIAAFPEHELVDEARDKAIKAAYQACRLTYEQGNYAKARQCLLQFRDDFPTNGYEDDVDELLEALDNQPAPADTSEHAES